MKTNSKQIGNRFERYISRLLSLKISNGERDDLFWRTPASGLIGKKSNLYEGDIMLIDESGKYKWNLIVECKTTNKGSIIPLRSSVLAYLHQCFKRYGDKPWILILQIRGFNDVYIIAPDVVFYNHINAKPITTIEYHNRTLIVCDFFEANFLAN